MEDKIKEMQIAMEERYRQLEARMEIMDKRANIRSDSSTQRFLGADEYSPTNGNNGLSTHIDALEISLEQVLEMMLPHVGAILEELERRVPAEYLYSNPPPSSKSKPKKKKGSTSHQISVTPTVSFPDTSINNSLPCPKPRTKIHQISTSEVKSNVLLPGRDLTEVFSSQNSAGKTTAGISSVPHMNNISTKSVPETSSSKELPSNSLMAREKNPSTIKYHTSTVNKIPPTLPSTNDSPHLISSQNSSAAMANSTSLSIQNALGSSSFPVTDPQPPFYAKPLQPDLTDADLAALILAQKIVAASSDSETTKTISQSSTVSNTLASGMSSSQSPPSSTFTQNLTITGKDKPAIKPKPLLGYEQSGSPGIFNIQLTPRTSTPHLSNSTNSAVPTLGTVTSGSPNIPSPNFRGIAHIEDPSTGINPQFVLPSTNNFPPSDINSSTSLSNLVKNTFNNLLPNKNAATVSIITTTATTIPTVSPSPVQNMTSSTRTVLQQAVKSSPSQQPDPNQSDQRLVRAAVSGSLRDVSEALKESPSLDTTDGYGQTALHWAAWRGEEKMVELLLNRGANPRLRNSQALTPLHVAAGRGHGQCVAFLVDAGVDLNAPSRLGRTALHLAASRGHEGVVNVLVAAGADREAKDDGDMTALDMAASVAIRQLFVG